METESKASERTAKSREADSKRTLKTTDEHPSNKGIRATIRKIGFQITDPEEKPYRRININEAQPRKYLTNSISSGKYTMLSFIPKFLFEQFRRYSNVFFLAISCFQQIPGVSPTGRFTTLVPLIFIMCVSAAKEILEDLKRHRSDRTTNNRRVLVFRGKAKPESIHWADVQVGDFCKVLQDEAFPADLILYSSSEDNGICYVETSNLDGETNLKIRQALPPTSSVRDGDVQNIKGFIECEEPNRFLYEFLGRFSVDNGQSDHALTPDQVLLRGSRLQNTAWVIGQVIYTGHETKLMKNASKAPLKRSSVEKITNKQIFLLFLMLMAIAVTYTILCLWWIHVEGRNAWYLLMNPDDPNSAYHRDPSYSFAYTMFTFVILFNTLVPISLTVSLEIVRFIQAKFIEKDLDMYYEPSDIPATAKTSNLNEELGLIRYIFSDKTGTLTQNVMEFKGCSIGGEIYRPDSIGEGDTSMLSFHINQGYRNANDLREFLIILAVCHTVIPDRSTGSLVYHASSPDERALVIGALKHGCAFDSRTPTTVTIKNGIKNGNEETYEILHTLEFNSDRKRMSVIVRRPDGRLMLFCKGADAIIFDRLSSDPNVNPEAERTITQQHLDDFAKLGLRTLCLAERPLDQSTYDEWSKDFHSASVSITGHEQKVAEVEERIETNLRLVGATAVEDKLQDDVPETIACLLEAGISIWVLTGDKQETAINIGRSCNLLTEDMKLFILNADSLGATYSAVMTFMEDLHGTYGEHIPGDVDAAVVVDGKTLHFATNKHIKTAFVSLCTYCRVVICCRSSPFQKAEIVGEVTKKTGRVTLAIGDGANDVAMIQKAHVGVGIAGVEGLQAAASSDYAIGQFRYLRKLLLVHGAWNYNRIGKVILYCFYKNILLYVIQFWFGAHNGFSGQILFDKWIIALYNLIFTALQPLAIGLFEKHVRAEMRLRFPRMYFENQASFSMRVFVWWVVVGCAQSLAIYGFAVNVVGDGIVWSHGREGGYLVLGNYVYTYVIFVASLKAGFELKSWTLFSHLAIWGSIILWLFFLPFYGYVSAQLAPRLGTDIIGNAEMVYTSVCFWAGLPVIVIVCFLPELVLQVLRNHFAEESEEERRREEDVLLQDQDSNEKIMLATQSTIYQIKERLEASGFSTLPSPSHDSIPPLTSSKSLVRSS